MAVWTVVKYAVALLLVVAGSLCFVAAADLRGDIPQDYRYEVTELNGTEVPSRVAERIETENPSRVTGPNETATPYADESQHRVLDFSNLSSSAQTIFRNTLDSGGNYTTDTHPADFQLNSDTNRRNYVRYQNSTYRLNVHTVRTEQFFEQLSFALTVVVGVSLSVLGGGSLLWWNRKCLRKQSPF
jgi:hypothetical protein